MKEKHILVLTRPLKTEPWQEDRLNKKMESTRKIYNVMVAKYRKTYQKMINCTEWKESTEIIKEELTKMGDGAKKVKKSPALKAAYDIRNRLIKEYGLTEYSIIGSSTRHAAHYKTALSAVMTRMTIGVRIWRAVNRLLYGNGSQIHFKRYGTLNSLSTDGKSGIRLLSDSNGYFLLLSNQQAHAKKIKIYLNIREDDSYAATMLNCPIKAITVIRRLENSKWHYYAQLSVDVSDCLNTIRLNNVIGAGRVGIAIWRGECYAVSDGSIKRFVLAPGQDEFEVKRSELDRRIEQLRRHNNPNNYNSDGTIITGRLKWYQSHEYRELVRKKRELERINGERLKLHRQTIVRDIMSMGDEFLIQDSSYSTKKEEYNPEDEKTVADYNKAKERRRAIQIGAPADLIATLNQKLDMYGLSVTKVTIPKDLYWYQHDVGISSKALLATHNCSIAGIEVSQTAYRAWLLLGYDPENNEYDQAKLREIWPPFKNILS